MRRALRNSLTLATLAGVAMIASPAAAQSAAPPQRIIDIEILGTRKDNEIKLAEKNRNIDVTVLGSVNFKIEDIDKATVQIEGVRPVSVNGRKVDYNEDQNPDVEYRISVGKLKIDESTSTLCVTGALLDGTTFRGCGPVTVKP